MSLIKNLKFSTKGVRKSKRLGRGYGSGKGGHTVGRGQKGQNSRGKNKVKVGFAGRQTPLHLKLPQYRGVSKGNKGVKYPNIAVNLSILEQRFNEGDVVNKLTLSQKGILSLTSRGKIKILGTGELTKKLKFDGVLISKVALEKIQKIGCIIVNEKTSKSKE